MSCIVKSPLCLCVVLVNDSCILFVDTCCETRRFTYLSVHQVCFEMEYIGVYCVCSVDE